MLGKPFTVLEILDFKARGGVKSHLHRKGNENKMVTKLQNFIGDYARRNYNG